MEIPYDLIRRVARDYFEADFIESFIDIVKNRAANARKSFFQLIQKDNKPTLEFGCLCGQGIVDITASVDSTIVLVAPISALNIVILQESFNATNLRVETSFPQEIFYLAVGEEYRKELREYGNFLQSVLTGE